MDDDKQRAGNHDAEGVPWWRGGTAWRPRSGCEPEQDTESVGVGEGWVPGLGDDMCQGEMSPRGPSSSLPTGLDFWGTAEPFPSQK